MENRRNHETSAVATLLRVPSAAEIERRLQRRRLQHASFVQRLETWALERAGGDLGAVVVEHPRDDAVIIALGVPCEDCLTLVYSQGEDGHVVRFGALPGVSWSEFIVAQCGRSGL